MANFHIVAGASEVPAHPVVRKITTADLKEALTKGFDDFWRCRLTSSSSGSSIRSSVYASQR